jgi:hypothetical protein
MAIFGRPVDDDQPGDELMQIGVGHGDLGRDVTLDDEAKLDLVVEKTNVPRLDQRGIGRHDATGRLGEEHVERFGVRVHAGFDHVLAIVCALAKELLVRCHRREDRCLGDIHLIAPQPDEIADQTARDECIRGRKVAGDGRDPPFADHAPLDAPAELVAHDIDSHG